MTEFTGIDMEMSWVNTHDDVMSFQERWLQYCYQRVKDEHGEEITKFFGVDLQVPTVPFPRITMEEALQILKKGNYRCLLKRRAISTRAESAHWRITLSKPSITISSS